jgi:hypothetical protein
MAKSTRGGRPDRKVAAKSSKPAEVEVVEPASTGIGWEGGGAIVAAAVLLVALLMVDHELGAMGAGMFFK